MKWHCQLMVDREYNPKRVRRATLTGKSLAVLRAACCTYIGCATESQVAEKSVPSLNFR